MVTGIPPTVIVVGQRAGAGDGCRLGGAGGCQNAGELASQEELRAVGQLIVQRDFGNGGLDQHLQRGEVDFAQHAFDHSVFARRRIDQERVVAPIGDDADAVLGLRPLVAGQRLGCRGRRLRHRGAGRSP
jgi:hypothetical protein